MATDALKASQGSLYIQRQSGKPVEYIGCVDLDAITDPRGDVTFERCRDANGDYIVVGETQDEPGNVTTSFGALVFANADILDELTRCRFNIYASLIDCGKRGVFANYVRMLILRNARITSEAWANVVMRKASDFTTRTFDVTAWNPVYKVRTVTVRRQTIAETTDLNAIAFCNSELCAGDCGEQLDVFTEGFIGGDAPTGSPTERADVWQTDDKGATWTNTTGGAAHPFVSGEDIKAVGCAALDRSTSRWFAAREIVAGEKLKIAYSDDSGTTWTLVTITESINAEGVADADALFVLDRDHLWVASTEGAVYFSSDAGVTWAEQTGAQTASASESLNAIKFIDTLVGYAAGENGSLIKTTDGGETWEAVTEPSSNHLTALHVFTPFRLIVGTAVGTLYETWNSGDDWESKTYSGQAATDTIEDVEFSNDLTGFMIVNTSAPLGSAHRSLDGGHTWEKLTVPTNAGFNALTVANENLAFIVGNDVGGTGFVAKISG